MNNKTENTESKNNIPENERAETFLSKIDQSIKFHQTNTNDPYGISNAVIVALTEVKNAYRDAFCN